MIQPARKRIVITGMGVVSPNGIGVDAFARALAAGESGISNIDHIKADGLKSWAAGQVRDFDAAKVIDPAEASATVLTSRGLREMSVEPRIGHRGRRARDRSSSGFLKKPGTVSSKRLRDEAASW